jgi:hypothetical protein
MFPYEKEEEKKEPSIFKKLSEDKVEHIKLVRAASNVGLVEGKEIVEWFLNNLPLPCSATGSQYLWWLEKMMRFARHVKEGTYVRENGDFYKKSPLLLSEL